MKLCEIVEWAWENEDEGDEQLDGGLRTLVDDCFNDEIVICLGPDNELDVLSVYFHEGKIVLDVAIK